MERIGGATTLINTITQENAAKAKESAAEESAVEGSAAEESASGAGSSDSQTKMLRETIAWFKSSKQIDLTG